MLLDWNDYSAESGTESVPLLLSDRSQLLILAAMQYLDFRSNWVGVDDATWDDIDAAIGEAYEEITEQAEIVNDGTPVGAIVFWMNSIASAPEKWLACNGATLLIADYPELADALDGQYRISGTEIQLPDLRNRFLYGGDNNDDIGDVGGESAVALTVSQLPPHSHGISSSNAAGNSTSFLTRATGATPNTNNTNNTGTGEAHNNLPPFVRGWWIIKALP